MTTPAPTYPMVYRLLEPPAYRGRLCRVTAYPPVQFSNGLRRYHAGEELTAIEFDNGEKATVTRASIVYAASKPGRAAIFKAARGGTPLIKERRRRRGVSKSSARGGREEAPRRGAGDEVTMSPRSDETG